MKEAMKCRHKYVKKGEVSACQNILDNKLNFKSSKQLICNWTVNHMENKIASSKNLADCSENCTAQRNTEINEMDKISSKTEESTKKFSFKIESFKPKSSVQNPIFPILQSDVQDKIHRKRWDQKEKVVMEHNVRSFMKHDLVNFNAKNLGKVFTAEDDKNKKIDPEFNSKYSPHIINDCQLDVANLNTDEMIDNSYSYMDVSSEEDFEDYIIRINCAGENPFSTGTEKFSSPKTEFKDNETATGSISKDSCQYKNQVGDKLIKSGDYDSSKNDKGKKRISSPKTEFKDNETATGSINVDSCQYKNQVRDKLIKSGDYDSSKSDKGKENVNHRKMNNLITTSISQKSNKPCKSKLENIDDIYPTCEKISKECDDYNLFSYKKSQIEIHLDNFKKSKVKVNHAKVKKPYSIYQEKNVEASDINHLTKPKVTKDITVTRSKRLCTVSQSSNSSSESSGSSTSNSSSSSSSQSWSSSCSTSSSSSSSSSESENSDTVKQHSSSKKKMKRLTSPKERNTDKKLENFENHTAQSKNRILPTVQSKNVILQNDKFEKSISEPKHPFVDSLVDYKSDEESPEELNPSQSLEEANSYKLFPSNKKEHEKTKEKKIPEGKLSIKMFLKTSTAQEFENLIPVNQSVFEETKKISFCENQHDVNGEKSVDNKSDQEQKPAENEAKEDVRNERNHQEKASIEDAKNKCTTFDTYLGDSGDKDTNKEQQHKSKPDKNSSNGDNHKARNNRSRSRSTHKKSDEYSSGSRKRSYSKSCDDLKYFSKSHDSHKKRYKFDHHEKPGRKQGSITRREDKGAKSLSRLTGKPVVSKEFQKLAEELKQTNGARNIVFDDLGPLESAPAGYCFVEFPDRDSAHNAMLRLNGKGIPGSKPHKLFKLNHASFGREHLLIPEYSLYVGELTKDVDDLALYRAFASRYSSVRAAKVVIDSYGGNKGFGFVRFRSEEEQQLALIEMQNFSKLGGKPIRVSLAVPKKMQASLAQQSIPHSFQQQQQGTAYNNQYYQQYQQTPYHYGSNPHQQQQQKWWMQYQEYYGGYTGANHATTVPGVTEDVTQASTSTDFNNATAYSDGSHHTYSVDDETLEDPEIEIDVEKANKEFMERSEELYMAIEGSRWHPLDNVFSQIVPDVPVKN